jgi:hypothetical protein
MNQNIRCVVPFDIVAVPPVQPGYKAGGRGSSSEQPLPRNIHILLIIPCCLQPGQTTKQELIRVLASLMALWRNSMKWMKMLKHCTESTSWRESTFALSIWTELVSVADLHYINIFVNSSNTNYAGMVNIFLVIFYISFYLYFSFESAEKYGEFVSFLRVILPIK